MNTCSKVFHNQIYNLYYFIENINFMTKNSTHNLIIILGDQLSLNISSLDGFDKQHDRILMMEVAEEATYVPHHVYKIILIFSAMRHFAKQLQAKGYQIEYIAFDAKQNKGNFTDNLLFMAKKFQPESIIITEPGEYRVLQLIKSWRNSHKLPVTIRLDTRFLCSLKTFKTWAQSRKELRMEYFYRLMRQKHNVLMDKGKPIGGKYNFDTENRKPPKQGLQFRKRLVQQPDAITRDVITLCKKHFKRHMGTPDRFQLAVTRDDALKQLDYFVKYYLPEFGDYQDAMLLNEYNLNHSMLSMYLNIGLLLPQEVITKAEHAFHSNLISLNNCEGFIRQILGWREFVRGLYWLKMPDYLDRNYLNANANLPSFYWTAKTDMLCMKQALTQTIETATSHHIQRLMVTGNFAMLLGVLPKAICEWYLAVYADAFEWVELPNTLGMSQYADGGIMASKPYAASGNYINKMSNFCQNCRYNVKEKLTENACPFNDLYWGFLIDNKLTLATHPRLTFAYNYVNKMDAQLQKAYSDRRKELIQAFAND